MSERNPDGRVSRRRMLRNTAIVGGSAAFATPVIQSVTVSAAASSHTGGEEDPGTVVSNTSDLEIWLRADTGVTIDSGGVSHWEDQAGSDHDATQGSTPSRPTLISNAVNGLPAVQFDGNDDYLGVAFDLNPSVNPNLTIFTVWASHTIVEAPYRKVYSHDNSLFDRTIGIDDRVSTNFTYFGGPGHGNEDYFDIAADTAYLTSDQWTTTTFSGWRNGTAVAAGPVDSGPGHPTFRLGSNPSFGEYWDGWIAEFILYARILSDAERQLVENYLLTKYAIS